MPNFTSQSHPCAETLRRFGNGEIHGPESDDIAQHLETCDDCCQELRNFSLDPLLARLQAAAEHASNRSTWREPAPANSDNREEVAMKSIAQNQLRVTLTAIAGPHKGRTFTFTDHDTFIVGRSQRAHFRLATKDRYFSRFHFLVEVNPPQCRLLDMNSRNGTFVNGKRIVSADLSDGDRIKAGHTFLLVALVGGEVAEPTPLRPALAQEPAAPLKQLAAAAISIRTALRRGAEEIAAAVLDHITPQQRVRMAVSSSVRAYLRCSLHADEVPEQDTKSRHSG